MTNALTITSRAAKAPVSVVSENVVTASMDEARIVRIPSTASAPISKVQLSGRKRSATTATAAAAATPINPTSVALNHNCRVKRARSQFHRDTISTLSSATRWQAAHPWNSARTRRRVPPRRPSLRILPAMPAVRSRSSDCRTGRTSRATTSCPRIFGVRTMGPNGPRIMADPSRVSAGPKARSGQRAFEGQGAFLSQCRVPTARAQVRRQIGPALILLKRVQTAASSRQSHLPLIYALAPCARRIFRSSCEQHCLPQALWRIQSRYAYRRAMAIFSARIARSRVMRLLTARQMTRRERRSRMTTRYRHLSRVRMQPTSPAHFRSG